MKEYLYYTYICQPSNELRGRTSKAKRKPPCGRKSKHQTPKEITHISRHQTKCQCGNRPRLTPTNTTRHDNDADAMKAVAQANREWVL